MTKKDKQPILISEIVGVLSGKPGINELEFPMGGEINNPEFQPYVRQILDILGHPEAFVTDETMIDDFICFQDRNEHKKVIENLRQCLGFEVRGEDFLVEVAKKMKGGG